jgi:UDP-N-acetylmuramoyl-L-alanyl-D-glutamate--2,6-diaminopimelate ligase
MSQLAAARRPSAAAPGWRALGGLRLAGIAADSRRVRPGFLFAALPGLGPAARADGRAFIADAVANGAAAILAPAGTAWPPGVPPRPLIEDPEPRRRLAELAAAFAGPAPKTIAAVTGTNGKTSTVEFLRQLWALAGHQAASLGTLGLVTGEGREPGALTTPDPVVLAETMARLARADIQRVAIEASSHGLDQFRLDGLALAAAGFASFSRDHLDYHPGMAAYRAAKLRLFAELLPEGAAAAASAALDATTLAGLRAIARRRRLRLEIVRLERTVPVPEGQRVTIAGTEILLPLPGRFQAENAALAARLAFMLGDAEALSRLPSLRPVRGRLERAAILPNGAASYVDYAHTPDALKTLLAALRPHTQGRLLVVFGAGGDRDPGKRAAMGRAAAAGADRVIVTDDNPRTEDPARIRRAVLAGCPGATEIGDRARAIAAALSELGPGDVLAVAGKGHESGQVIGTEIFPFDDVAVIRRLVGDAP